MRVTIRTHGEIINTRLEGSRKECGLSAREKLFLVALQDVIETFYPNVRIRRMVEETTRQLNRVIAEAGL